MILQATVDKDNKIKYESSPVYNPTKRLTPSHWAYPLITTLVWKAIKQQLIHIANGCLSDDGEDMNIVQREKKYKKTDKRLPVYVSTRGTSKNEAFHSVTSAKSREWHQIGTNLYDARLLWLVTHYNRKKLRMNSKQALPDGISPSEAGQNEVVLASVEDAEKVKFGFEYFESVKNTQVEIVINHPTNSASTSAPTHGTNYELLQGIEVPNELGLEDIDRIGKVLERALPDASTVVPNKVDTSLPPDVIEECTESLSQYKQHQPPVSQVQYPTQGKEIDNDSYTRSTASTLTADTSTLTANSTIPCLNARGDTNLSRRQQTARDTMIENGISLDIGNSRGRNNNCPVCFKDRGSFTFQSRRHMQINKAEKGATLRWYCPLADPIEQYYELLRRREELKRERNKKSSDKRKAKRQGRSLT